MSEDPIPPPAPDAALADDLAALRERLVRAADGLLFESETEAPFEFFVLPAGAEPPGALEPDAGAAQPVEERTLERFVRRHLEVDPRDPEAVAQVDRWRALLDALRDALAGPRVWRVGEGRVRYYALGRTTDGRWAGLRTTALET